MFPTPVSRFSICALVVAGAILGHPNDAKADPVVVGHNVVYFDESGTAYSLDQRHKHKGPDGKWILDHVQGIDFKKVDGVPTATQKDKFALYPVNPGSTLIKDSASGSSESDLIVFGPIPKPGSKQKQTMQFCSDNDTENPPDPKADSWADVGLSKCQRQDPVQPFTEVDLSNFTVEVEGQAGETFPTDIDLKGKFGYIYVAKTGMPGAALASGENTIVYVFVSDSCGEGPGKSPTSSCAPTVPEPPSLLLLGSSLFVLACLPIVMRFRWLIL